MNTDQDARWTRRDALLGLSAAGATVLGLGAGPATAEPPPETTSIRLIFDPNYPVLCRAPQYIAEEFLKLEGFNDVQYVDYGKLLSEYELFDNDAADMSAGLNNDYVYAIDAGHKITVLAGLHAGCVELFANERVAALRDIGGKRLVVLGPDTSHYRFLASVAAFIGLDPRRDIEWVVEPDVLEWPRLLAKGEVDVVNAFPPQNLEIREMGIGHVILNTTTDDPWRHFFCCLVAARSDFVRDYPIATKRAIRAFIKANQFCEFDKEGAARKLVERGATDRYDFALTTLEEVPYGVWRDYDLEATLRFFSLRLREVGLVEKTPREILEIGTDFRFIDELRRELKV